MFSIRQILRQSAFVLMNVLGVACAGTMAIAAESGDARQNSLKANELDADIPAFVSTASAGGTFRMARGDSGLFLLRNDTSPLPAAKIKAVHPSGLADIIVLDVGTEQKLYPGMILQVNASSGTDTLGNIILIASSGPRAAALVLDVASGKTFRAGDFVTPKLLGT